MVTAEVAVIYYALFSWRAKPEKRRPLSMVTLCFGLWQSCARRPSEHFWWMMNAYVSVSASGVKQPFPFVMWCAANEFEAGSVLPKSINYWRTTVLTDPQYLIELVRPATVIGLWGTRKQVTLIGMAVVQGSSFAAHLNVPGVF